VLTFLRTVALLTLVFWIGGIFFFAAVETQSAIHVLGISRPFGDIVNLSLHALHRMGLACGLIFLLVTLLLDRLSQREYLSGPRPLGRDLRPLVIVLMLLFTAISEYGVLPRMHRIRSENPEIEQLSRDTGPRAEFDRLHHYSTNLEGTVLLLGFVTVTLTARRLT
jgi:Domain of unknown function (DUF4149)